MVILDFEDALRSLRAQSVTLDGEAVWCGQDGISDFEKLHSRAYDRQVFLYGFDLPELNGEDCRSQPLGSRGSGSRSRSGAGEGASGASKMHRLDQAPRNTMIFDRFGTKCEPGAGGKLPAGSGAGRGSHIAADLTVVQTLDRQRAPT